MKIPYIMTPGPTEVRENVRLARALECYKSRFRFAIL